MNITEFQVKHLNLAEGKRHLDYGYSCGLFRNKGLIYKAVGDEVVSYRCSCQSIRKSLHIINRSGLSHLVEKMTFDNYIVKEQWQQSLKDNAISFAKSDTPSPVFFLGGQSGSGKTHLCTAITRELMLRGFSTLYFVWPQESKHLKSIANEPFYSQSLDKFKTVDVLYVDDFLKTVKGTPPTPADMSLAFDILNHRLTNPGKITVISTEMTIKEIMELDEATASRIKQVASNHLHIVGKDATKNYRLR